MKVMVGWRGNFFFLAQNQGLPQSDLHHLTSPHLASLLTARERLGYIFYHHPEGIHHAVYIHCQYHMLRAESAIDQSTSSSSSSSSSSASDTVSPSLRRRAYTISIVLTRTVCGITLYSAAFSSRSAKTSSRSSSSDCVVSLAVFASSSADLACPLLAWHGKETAGDD